ncbi:MAG: hypothetical protein KJO12_06995 [Ignavibacteria bacterium]|nr:hypothetical protein [Ignavibacteria bacterium]
MEQKEQKQQIKEDKYWCWGCCDFTSGESKKMFRMMPFSFDRFGNSFNCRSMMKNMSCKPKKNNS